MNDMANKRKTVIKKPKKNNESDSAYFLKVVLYFLMSTFWLRLIHIEIGPLTDLSIPVGFMIGLLFASHEHFQIDRKIEYAILLAGTVLSFYLPVGIRF